MVVLPAKSIVPTSGPSMPADVAAELEEAGAGAAPLLGDHFAHEDEERRPEPGRAEGEDGDAGDEAEDARSNADDDEAHREQGEREGRDARVRAEAITDPSRDRRRPSVDERQHRHQHAGGALLASAEEREVALVDEEDEGREDHAAGGEVQREVERTDGEETAVAHRAERLTRRGARRRNLARRSGTVKKPTPSAMATTAAATSKVAASPTAYGEQAAGEEGRWGRRG